MFSQLPQWLRSWIEANLSVYLNSHPKTDVIFSQVQLLISGTSCTFMGNATPLDPWAPPSHFCHLPFTLSESNPAQKLPPQLPQLAPTQSQGHSSLPQCFLWLFCLVFTNTFSLLAPVKVSCTKCNCLWLPNWLFSPGKITDWWRIQAHWHGLPDTTYISMCSMNRQMRGKSSTGNMHKLYSNTQQTPWQLLFTLYVSVHIVSSQMPTVHFLPLLFVSLLQQRIRLGLFS